MLTGIVPILSLYKHHVRNLLRLDPAKYLQELRERERRIVEIERAEESRSGSLAQKVVSTCARDESNQSRLSRRDQLSASLRRSIVRHDELYQWDQLRGNMKEMKNAASLATRSIYGIVFLCILPVMGVTLLALMWSWNTIPAYVYPSLMFVLKYFTMAFQSLFAIASIFFWDGNSLLAYVDLVMCLLSPFADWYWVLQCEKHTRLLPVDLFLYSILTGYMITRLWSQAVMPTHQPWHDVGQDTAKRADRLDLVWTTRSAAQVSEILPDILDYWQSLVDSWGLENTHEVCRISIFITDPDKEACSMLKRELRRTVLYQKGAFQFQRPDFSKLIEDHTIDMICTRRNTYSLLAFCGSPTLASEIHHHKISNDMTSAITGAKNHQMEFVSESYGGVKASPKVNNKDGTHSDSEDMLSLTTRKEKSYFSNRGFPEKGRNFKLLQDGNE